MGNYAMRTTRSKFSFCLFLFLSPVTSFNGNRDILRFPNDTNSWKNISKKDFETQSISQKLSNDNLESKNEQIGLLFFLLSILILLLSSLLLSVIWNYLNNVSTAKRCFLLYLYQDMIGIALLTSWVWFGLILYCYMIVNGTILNSTEATIFSISLKSLALGFGILSSLSSVIKLYQMKESVIDLPNPWDAEEERIISKVRIMVILIILLYATGMSLVGFQPLLYFFLAGDNISFLELPYGSIMFECLFGFVFAIPAFTFILDCCLRSKERQALAIQIERKFQSIVFLMILVTLIGGIIMKTSSKSKDNILIIGELLVVIACLEVPLWIIVSSHPLRQYTKRTAFDYFSLVTRWMQQYIGQIIAIFRHCRRASQIMPIE